MAITDKNIVITPNKGAAADPKIVFSGADATTANQDITLRVYPQNSGTLSFEGSAGQLLSVTNLLTGTIYSVNDISGIPSIEVIDTGLVKLGQYNGNVLIGTGTEVSGFKLQLNGNMLLGNRTGVSSASPMTISLGGTWSDTLGGKLKLKIYEDSNGAVSGFGASNGQLDYVTPSGVSHVWYLNGSRSMKLASSGYFSVGSTDQFQVSPTGAITTSSFLNTVADVRTEAPSHIAMQVASDNWLRWQTLAQFKTSLNIPGLMNWTFVDRSVLNLDTAARVQGIYASSGAPLGTGVPAAANYINLIHLTNSSDVAFQIMGGYNTDNMWFRGGTNWTAGTGWGTWRKVWHDGNFTPSSYSTTGHTHAILTLTTGNGLSATANYDGSTAVTVSHLGTTGYKHIPSGGATGNYLGWSSDGTATWSTPPDTNTWIANALSTAGYVAAPTAGNANQVWKCDASGNPAWRAESDAYLGTVTSVSVVSANGFTGTSNGNAATPAITLTTSINGLMKGNGTALALAGLTDISTAIGSQTANYFYAAPNGTAGTPVFRAIVAADIPTLNQSTTGSAGSVAQALTITSGYGLYSAASSYNGSAAVTISHLATDGYAHVPATGTTNNGKFLMAGAAAGSLSWGTPANTVTLVQGTGGTAVSGTVLIQGTGLISTSQTGQTITISTTATSNTGTVTSVASGNGMNFTAISGSGSVVLGTPTTVSTANGNAVTATSHSHAISLVSADIPNNAAQAGSVAQLLTVTQANGLSSTVGTYNGSAAVTISHLGTDGNLHVPATSTASNNKVLVAGSTAGAMSWSSSLTLTSLTVDSGSSDLGFTLQSTHTSPTWIKLNGGLGFTLASIKRDSTNVNAVNFSTAYGLILNSSGGNVLIGQLTDDATNKVQITGGTKITGNLNVTGTLTGASHSQAESTITFTDITTGNASTTAHGYLPKLNNSATTFLNGQGGWTTPTDTNTVTRIQATGGTLVSGDIVIQGSGTISASQAGNTITISASAAGSITIGNTAIALGASANTFTGLASLTLDQIATATPFTISSSLNPASLGATIRGIFATPIIGTNATGNVNIFQTYPVTTNNTFTLSNLAMFRAGCQPKGAASTITTVQGFVADAQLGTAGATNAYGFRGELASGTNVYNIYCDGTAKNYLYGAVGIGLTPQTGSKLYTYLLATDITQSEYGIYSNCQAQTASSTMSKHGIIGRISVMDSHTSTGGVLAGTKGQVVVQGTAISAAQSVIALYGDINFNAGSTGTLGGVVGVYVGSNDDATSTVTCASAVGVQVADMTIATKFGLASTGGCYALYLGNTGTAASQYNIYAPGASPNYLNGALSVGNVSFGSNKFQVLGTSQIWSDANLGSAVNDVSFPFSVTTYTTNISSLKTGLIRLAASPTDWTTSQHRIQQHVDSTYMPYIGFGGPGSDQIYGISFGTGSGSTSQSAVERMTIDQNGKIKVGPDWTSTSTPLPATLPMLRVNQISAATPATSGTENGSFRTSINYTSGTANTNNTYGCHGLVEIASTNTIAHNGSIQGTRGIAVNYGSAGNNSMYGLVGSAHSQSSGGTAAITLLVGCLGQSNIQNASVGFPTVATQEGVKASACNNRGGGTTPTGATVTDQYGLHAIHGQNITGASGDGAIVTRTMGGAFDFYAGSAHFGNVYGVHVWAATPGVSPNAPTITGDLIGLYLNQPAVTQASITGKKYGIKQSDSDAINMFASPIMIGSDYGGDRAQWDGTSQLQISGQVNITGTFYSNGIDTRAASRMVGDLKLKATTATTGYGFILRNDGTNTYMLLTANNNADGSWRDPDRPFVLNNAGGTIAIALSKYTETQATASPTTTQTVDLSIANNFAYVLSGNVTFTFSNPPASGTVQTFTIKLTQDATGSRTVTWPSTVRWPGGVAPTMTATANKCDFYTFTTSNAGGIYHGFVAGQNYAIS